MSWYVIKISKWINKEEEVVEFSNYVHVCLDIGNSLFVRNIFFQYCVILFLKFETSLKWLEIKVMREIVNNYYQTKFTACLHHTCKYIEKPKQV